MSPVSPVRASTVMNVPGVHYPHRIRLRGPWKSQPLSDSVRWSRRFGYPGRIDADERVWLTFSGFGGRVEVALNGRVLGCHNDTPAFDHEATRLLDVRNELVLVVAGGGETLGDVALEIRRTAFLRSVRAEADGGRIRVTGEVVGSAERPLELYVLLDGHSIHYMTIDPAADGRAFEVDTEQTGGTVRVELVDGGSVWYEVELPLAA